MKAGSLTPRHHKHLMTITPKTNKAQQIKTDYAHVNYGTENMPDYHRSSINRAADKRAGQLLMNKINM